MKALLYRRSIPRYLLSAFFSAVQRRRFHHLVTPLALEEVAFKPARPGWSTLRTRLCGICGSDVNLLKGAESMLLEPYASLPMVLGHEILADVESAPSGQGPAPGARVVVEPVLDCAVREMPPCPACARGDYNLCERFLDGALPPGSVLGFNAAASGGMAPLTAAHPGKLLPVPENVSDEDAVLTDSMASAMQPVLENFPAPGQSVLVIGAGILGQHTVRCLRALGFAGRIVLAARHPFQADLGRKGGADEILRKATRQELARAFQGRFLPTAMGGGNIEGGADVVFDCVASPRTLEDALVTLRARGRYVMIGTAGTIRKADLSSLWFRQLTVTGTAMYATASWNGERVRTYQLCLDLLASGSYPTAGLFSGAYPLADWKKAFQAAFDKSGSGSMKLAFDPRA